jgi:uncharacterized protein (DUF3820 family)
MENNQLNEQMGQRLIKLAHYKMPFGKYSGRYLTDLPEAYIIWYRNKGLPKGELGEMLAEMIEIKTNGLEYLLRKIRNKEAK